MYVRTLDTKIGDPLQKLVLLQLADTAGFHGECFFSPTKVSARCEINSRDLIKVLDRLLAAQHVSRVRSVWFVHPGGVGIPADRERLARELELMR